MTEKIQYIPVRMKNASVGGHIGGADDIIDDVLGKEQSQINQERISDVNNIKGGSAKSIAQIDAEINGNGGIDERLGTVEQLAEISIGGGDAQIATGEDFTNPDATKRAKVPTVGAVLDGMNDGVYDVSKRNPTGGENSDGKFTLAYILTNADTLIPTSWRHGGMSISFVSSVDNKYVQYRLIADSFTTDTDYWSVCEENVIIESPEFIYVKCDSNNRVLWGINPDGNFYFAAGCPQQVQDYVLAHKQEIINILATKVDKVEGKGLSTNDLTDEKNDVLNTQELVESPEFIDVKTDKNNKLLESTDFQGTKYIHGDLQVNGKIINGGVQSIDELEVAVGKTASYGTYQSELDASPIVNDVDNHYIGYSKTRKGGETKRLSDIVIMNHDDLNDSDYIVSRKIHNKYGTKASFCAVFIPFASVEQAQEKIINVRKMINDGHEIGLHAMMGFSYWREQRLFDVKPDGSNTFAPNKAELLGANQDGTGINTFGTTITADTKVSDLYYGLNRTYYGNRFKTVKAVDMTDTIVNEATRQYVIYSDEETISGIDDTLIEDMFKVKNANVISLTSLQWLEKYYNHYIDNSLGYSKYDGTIAQRFAEDYSVPNNANVNDYYPDADHLLNGKMVYWNDTDNPHYAEAKVKTASGFSTNDYQLVGKFTKGLYKDGFSTCNYEITDRCILIAETYFRHFYGMKHFTDAHTHGIKYMNWFWNDTNGLPCLDRTKKILACNGSTFVSRIGAFVSEQEIFKGFGNYPPISVNIRRMSATKEGLAGFYYGQKGIKNYEINTVGVWKTIGETVYYLTLFGNGDTGLQDMSYNDYTTFTKGIDNFAKYFFEHNDQSVITRNGLSFKCWQYLHEIMLNLISAKGTGKVPVISVDTLSLNAPAQHEAVDIVLRFCKWLGYDVVPYREGLDHINGMTRNTEGNLFPNPFFRQSLLEYFGGSCTDENGYIPDGWKRQGGVAGNMTFSVGNKVLSITGIGILYTRIYGLPAGTYSLAYTINTTGETSTDENPKNRVMVRIVRNGDNINGAPIFKTTHSVQNTDITENLTINIPEPYREYDAENPVSVMLDGYQDNVCCIELAIRTTSDLSIKDISLYKN